MTDFVQDHIVDADTGSAHEIDVERQASGWTAAAPAAHHAANFQLRRWDFPACDLLHTGS